MQRLLHYLPSRPQPPVIRYGVTIITVGVSFAAMVGVHQAAGYHYGFYLLYPAVFLSAIAFDHHTGHFAVTLEAIGLYVLLRTPGSLLLPHGYLMSVALFVAIGLALAWASEGLRLAWDHASEAERSKELLLAELAHRTKNNLALVSSVLSLQARSSDSEDVRKALQTAVSRVHAIAAAQDHVERGRGANGVTDLRDYLEGLCRQLGEALSGIRPIAISADVESVLLPTARAVSIGLIVNELVTNALKHAFPGDRAGKILVTLRRNSTGCILTVSDDGIGYVGAPNGMGSRLVSLLVKQLHGTVQRAGNPGCNVRVTFRGGVE